MAHIKAQDVDWLDEAWRISAVIAAMPDTPPGLLCDFTEWPKLSRGVNLQIDSLLKTIAVHLGYRISVVHKASFEYPSGEKGLYWLNSVDPTDTKKFLALLIKLGVKLKPVDLWAFDAHMKLGRILLDRYVCKEWKRELPLIVASIGGATTSQTAKLKATQPRQRQLNALKEGKRGAVRRNPHSSWKELLNDLQGDDIVVDWDDENILWIDAEGNQKRTATQTFKNWKTD